MVEPRIGQQAEDAESDAERGAHPPPGTQTRPGEAVADEQHHRREHIDQPADQPGRCTGRGWPRRRPPSGRPGSGGVRLSGRRRRGRTRPACPGSAFRRDRRRGGLGSRSIGAVRLGLPDQGRTHGRGRSQVHCSEPLGGFQCKAPQAESEVIVELDTTSNGAWGSRASDDRATRSRAAPPAPLVGRRGRSLGASAAICLAGGADRQRSHIRILRIGWAARPARTPVRPPRSPCSHRRRAPRRLARTVRSSFHAGRNWVGARIGNPIGLGSVS